MRDFPGGANLYATGFSINECGYLCCGWDSAGNETNQFWEYYPAIDSWAHKSNYPGSARAEATSFSYKNFGYVGLGGGHGIVNDLWRYNQTSDSWSQMVLFPSESRLFSSVAMVDSFAYIFGGQLVQQPVIFTREIWRYDIGRNTWDSIGLMPNTVTREGSLIWSFDSVILGGAGISADSSGGNYYLLSDFYSLKPQLNQWSRTICQNFYDSIGASTTFVWGKKGYCFGGYTSDYSLVLYSNQMYSFDATQILARNEVGISEVRGIPTLKIYPNPLASGQHIKVETAEAGEISFHDILDQDILHSSLHSGMNELRLSSSSGLLFYTVVYHDGRTASGRVVVW